MRASGCTTPDDQQHLRVKPNVGEFVSDHQLELVIGQLIAKVVRQNDNWSTTRHRHGNRPGGAVHENIGPARAEFRNHPCEPLWQCVGDLGLYFESQSDMSGTPPPPRGGQSLQRIRRGTMDMDEDDDHACHGFMALHQPNETARLSITIPLDPTGEWELGSFSEDGAHWDDDPLNLRRTPSPS